jgi:hypothetical protein
VNRSAITAGELVSDPVTTDAEDQRPFETPLYSASFTSEAGFPQRMARAFFRFSMTRPRTIVVYVLLLVVITALGFVTSSRTPGVIPVLVILVFAITIGLSYRSLITRFRRTSPAGSHYALQLGETMMVATMFTITGFVILKHRNTRLFSIYPAQLFTPESLAFLRSKISA